MPGRICTFVPGNSSFISLLVFRSWYAFWSSKVFFRYLEISLWLTLAGWSKLSIIGRSFLSSRPIRSCAGGSSMVVVSFDGLARPDVCYCSFTIELSHVQLWITSLYIRIIIETINLFIIFVLKWKEFQFPPWNFSNMHDRNQLHVSFSRPNMGLYWGPLRRVYIYSKFQNWCFTYWGGFDHVRCLLFSCTIHNSGLLIQCSVS